MSALASSEWDFLLADSLLILVLVLVLVASLILVLALTATVLVILIVIVLLVIIIIIILELRFRFIIFAQNFSGSDTYFAAASNGVKPADSDKMSDSCTRDLIAEALWSVWIPRWCTKAASVMVS